MLESTNRQGTGVTQTFHKIVRFAETVSGGDGDTLAQRPTKRLIATTLPDAPAQREFG